MRLTPLALPLSGIALLTVALFGCGTTREAQYRAEPAAEASAEQVDEATQLIAEGDAAWAERKNVDQLKVALEKWEAASNLAPSGDLAIKLSRGHYFLADGFYGVEGDEKMRDDHYTVGLTWAEKAMGMLAPDFVAAIDAGEDHETAILKAPPEAVPAMYWHSTNLGKWAASKGFATRLKYKDDIASTMKHVKSLDEQFFYAAPWRYFGAFEAATSGLAGGSLDKSKTNFDTAVEKAPNYLGTKVLYAEYYCTKTQDRDLFEKLLKEVLAADPAADPEIEPENVREQKKAEKLLARIDEEF